jgi:hypothetical protein
MKNCIVYEGIAFNAEWIRSKSEKDFLKEGDVNKHWFEGDPNRTAKLKEVYALATKKEDAPAPAPEPAK